MSKFYGMWLLIKLFYYQCGEHNESILWKNTLPRSWRRVRCLWYGPKVTAVSVYMNNEIFSNDFSEYENFHYLLASGVLPFVVTTDAGAKKPVAQK